MEDFVADLYNLTFHIFTGIGDFGDKGLTIHLGNVASTAKSLFSYSTFKGIYSLTENITTGVIALAISVLTLMVLIDFIDKSLKFNKETSWEMILFTMVKFAVYLFLINNIRELLKDVMSIGIDLLALDKGFSSGGSITGFKKLVKKLIVETKVVELEAFPIVGTVISQVIMNGIFLALAVPMIGSQMAIWTPIITEFIAFAVLTFIAPLPIALLYGGHGPESRAFIMKAISTVLCLILDYVVLVVYCKGLGAFEAEVTTEGFSGLTDTVGLLVGIFFYNGLFGAMLSSTKQLAGEILR